MATHSDVDCAFRLVILPVLPSNHHTMPRVLYPDRTALIMALLVNAV